MAEHLQSCLPCQAELAGYRRLLRVLRSLRDEPVLFPSPELISETLTALSERLVDGDKRLTLGGRRDRWLVACAMVAIGLAAVGAGALVARSGLVRPGPGPSAPSRAVAVSAV